MSGEEREKSLKKEVEMKVWRYLLPKVQKHKKLFRSDQKPTLKMQVHMGNTKIPTCAVDCRYCTKWLLTEDCGFQPSYNGKY